MNHSPEEQHPLQEQISNKRKSILYLAWIVGLGLAFGALGVILTPFFTTTTPKGESLVLGIPLQPSSALMFVAIEKGYLSSNGLDVTVKEFPSGKRALSDGLFKNKVEAVSTAEIPVATAGFERDDFRIIACIFTAGNINAIVARRDSNIFTPSDLKGKRIGTQESSAVHFFLQRFLLAHNLLETDVTPLFMRAEKLSDALALGKVDAISMREPFVGEAKQLLGSNGIVFAKDGIYEQFELVVVESRLLWEKPVVPRRLIQALLEAERFAQNNPKEAAHIVAKRINADPRIIEKQLFPRLSLSVHLSQALILMLEDEARWIIKRAPVPPKSIPNYLNLIDSQPLKELRSESVTIF